MGPSFIILALGLGSGEVILWPYLTANFGLGIAFGALLGLSFQFFINMEIERYALAKGESVFVGLRQMFPWSSYWFIATTFIGFGIPGIVAASATLFAHLMGWQDFKWLAIGLLIFIGLILSTGKTVYEMMENITRTVLLIGSPLILILAVLLSQPSDFVALGKGLVGIGSDYFLLPTGIVLATFLAAFAYSGAGGNLNLTQSIYVKEKGYGMGIYAQKIAGLFRKKEEQEIKLLGEDFELNDENLANFRAWWKRINIEHLIIFWGIGLITISMLMLLSYNTVFKEGGFDKSDISFVIREGGIIGESLIPAIGIVFILAAAIMLFQTQLGVMDSNSRIMSENFALIKLGREGKINLSRIYFYFLWAQIAFGIILFLLNFKQPLQLIVLGAVINAVAMFVHIGLVNWMNFKVLPKQIQASIGRKIILGIIFLFFGVFSIITIISEISKFG